MVELIEEAAQTSPEVHACNRGDPDTMIAPTIVTPHAHSSEAPISRNLSSRASRPGPK